MYKTISLVALVSLVCWLGLKYIALPIAYNMHINGVKDKVPTTVSYHSLQTETLSVPEIKTGTLYTARFSQQLRDFVYKMKFGEEGRIEKSLESGFTKMTGSAAYEFSGGVIKYSDFKGDRWLFPAEEMIVSNETRYGTLTLYGVNGISVFSAAEQ